MRTAAIIILAPVLSQVATSVGIHPLHFGFVVVLNIVIGLLTPPLGVCLFVVCSLSRISIERLVRAIMPFFWSRSESCSSSAISP